MILDIEAQCRFWQQVEKTNNCWNWIGALSHGYGRIKIEKKCYLTHRLSYCMHYKDPGDLIVMHLCNNKRCVNPEHLLASTYSDNIRHAFESGQRIDGIFGTTSKFKDERTIQFIRTCGYETHILARLYSVDCKTIQNIRNRTHYSRVK